MAWVAVQQLFTMLVVVVRMMMMLMLMIITLLLMMAMARMAAVAPLLPLVPVLLGMLMMARWLVDQTACTEIHLEGRFAFEDRRQQLPACSAQVHLRSGTHTWRRTTSQTQPSTMTCPQCQHLLLLKVTQQMCCRCVTACGGAERPAASINKPRERVCVCE